MTLEPEQTYRYARPSEVAFVDGRTEVLLATSGGVTSHGAEEHPVFFEGFLGHPEQSAAGLLAVAKVARTRFYSPPGMVAAQVRAADPVVTSNGDRLRFESFSVCCGVHARLDLLPGSLDGPALGTGTTNVDFNPPMRDTLSRVDGIEPLHLRVGEDVVVTTLDGSVTERRVPLPPRWLKGFAEVQLAASRAEARFEVTAAEALRLVRGLPGGSLRKPVWVVPAGRGLRLTSRPSTDGVSLSGAGRLKAVEPLLRFAKSLKAYAADDDPQGSAGVWELQLEDARLVLTLSPDLSRGFSGEGGVLWTVADEQAADDADLVSALLAFEPTIDPSHLADQAGISRDRVVRALARLSCAGRVGYDTAEGAYFHRELPFDPERLASMHPRYRDAVSLVEAGAVRLDGRTAHVRSNDAEHVVRPTSSGDRCTCPWYAKHKGSRGPCKHILAAHVARSRTDAGSRRGDTASA